MPKTTRKNTTSRKHDRSPKRSRTVIETGASQVASTSAASTSIANEASQWRASKLSDSDTITKTNATKQYRLKGDDFDGIPRRTEQPMYIYKERDIERRAWEKHGGPEGFDNCIQLGSHGLFTRATDREGPMKDALVMVPTYPPRPTEPLPSSTSVDKVRVVLAEAASLPPWKDWGRKNLPGLAVISDYDENGEPTCEYRWSDDYLERLFIALIEVIEEHGTGPEGFEGIRWEMYDKCVKVLMAGPRYDRGQKIWTDDPAAEWLDGQLVSLGNTCRAKCPAGKQFNQMLPLRNPRGDRTQAVGVRPAPGGDRTAKALL